MDDLTTKLLNDCRSFADKHRGKNVQSGPHWPIVIRFPRLFDEAKRLQQRVDTLEQYISDYCSNKQPGAGDKNERFADLRELAAQATPRPWWRARHQGDLADIQKFLSECAAYYPDAKTLWMVGSGPVPENGVANGSEQVGLPAITGNGPTSESNMTYIVAACNALPALLDELERLRAALDKIRDEGQRRNADWCRRTAAEALAVRDEGSVEPVFAGDGAGGAGFGGGDRAGGGVAVGGWGLTSPLPSPPQNLRF